MTTIPMTHDDLLNEVMQVFHRFVASQPATSVTEGPTYVKRILSAKGRQQRVAVYKMLNHNREVGRNFWTLKEMARAASCSVSQVQNIRREWEVDPSA